MDKAAKQIVVDHGAIPGFMAAMTMPYSVKHSQMLDQLTSGDQITGEVVVSGDRVWLENIVVVKKANQTNAPAKSEFHEPKLGEQVPNFWLINQDGKRIRLRDYRGKAVLLTFIYTRCPLPDYCPLMSTNFALTEEALGKNRQAYSKTHLLTISFDPKYDTPKVLREYGEAYLQKNGKRAFQHWEFASAPSTEMKEIARFFGLFYEEEKGQIVHSMSTTIISPEGKIYRWYHGNDWKSSDVLNDLASSLADHPGKFAGSK